MQKEMNNKDLFVKVFFLCKKTQITTKIVTICDTFCNIFCVTICDMKKFTIVLSKRESMVRSIRIDKALHDKLCLMSKGAGISYNQLVVRCIEYALNNI